MSFFLPLFLSFLSSNPSIPSLISVSLTLSVFLCPDKGGESGRRWSLQRAGDFPDPGDKSRPGLLPRPPGPPDLLGVRSLSVYLPPPEVGRAKQQRGGDHLLRHHPGRTNHHCGIGDKSPCRRPTARQRIQVLWLILTMIIKSWVDKLAYLLSTRSKSILPHHKNQKPKGIGFLCCHLVLHSFNRIPFRRPSTWT